MYLEHPGGPKAETILRVTDHASIPMDPGNRDYREFLESQHDVFAYDRKAYDYYAQFKGVTLSHMAIVNSGGQIKIVDLPQGASHSGLIQSAPHGFEPGDEKFIKIKDGKVVVDWAGKMGKTSAIEADKLWDSRSPWQRIKAAYGRRK